MKKMVVVALVVFVALLKWAPNSTSDVVADVGAGARGVVCE